MVECQLHLSEQLERVLGKPRVPVDVLELGKQVRNQWGFECERLDYVRISSIIGQPVRWRQSDNVWRIVKGKLRCRKERGDDLENLITEVEWES